MDVDIEYLKAHYAGMARKYDSTRRVEAAQKTKEGILEAAFKLHGMGIFDLESLASEANVSLATVRKYFPTRDELLIGCTTWGMRYAVFPDIDEIAAVGGREERLRAGVAQMHRLYDSLFPHIWATYQNKDDSPVLDALIEQFDLVTGPVCDVVLAAWPADIASDLEARGVLRGLLSYLTYYALIREGGLSPEQAHGRIVEALLNSLQAMARRSRKEGANV
nr:K224 [uncultured bacterium]